MLKDLLWPNQISLKRLYEVFMNYIAYIETIILVVAIVLYFKSVKRNNYKSSEIANLKSEINKVNVSKTINNQKNKRNLTCTLEVVDFGNQSLTRLNNKVIDGKILDISAGGLGFLCEVDFPVTSTVVVKVNFSLNDETFTYSGIIVRKEAHKGNNHLVYGIQFSDIGINEQNQLNFLVNNLELSKRKIY
jgi:hypothetical protein